MCLTPRGVSVPGEVSAHGVSVRGGGCLPGGGVSAERGIGRSVCLGLKHEKLISKRSLGRNYGESTHTKVIHILEWNWIGLEY